MINEQVLLEQIQRPIDLGHTVRVTLHTKFQSIKQQFETFVEESGSSTEAWQRVGESVGRFLGQGIGLCCLYVIVPSVAMVSLLLMRVFKRGRSRWHKIRAWVNEPFTDALAFASPDPDWVDNEQNPTPAFTSKSTEDIQVMGEMTPLPPCDQAPMRPSLSRSVTFVQQAAEDLPKKLSSDGIKMAYHQAKHKTQHNRVLTGLVTAGFTALSFLAVQLDPAKESAIASSSPQTRTEEVSALPPPPDYPDLGLDPNDHN